MPQPPRRSSPLKGLLIGLMALALLAIAGLVVANMVSKPATVTYQNDDYKVPPPDTNPPPLPTVKTVGEAQDALTKNPFYAQSAPIPVRCTNQPINVGTATDEQVDAHFEGLMECLLRVWAPPVEHAGFIIVRPTVTIYGKEITTKCGKTGVNAFYCSADQQVYYSNQLAAFIKIVATDKWSADVVMAHEFGHALQGRTGILFSAHALGQQSGDEPTALEFSRRLETQADCFSGMFMNAVSVSLGIQQSDLNGILGTYEAVGDDVIRKDPNVVGNHGHAATRKFWGSTGLANTAVGKCNTFVAPSGQVR
jgi:predicted metalloprotease